MAKRTGNPTRRTSPTASAADPQESELVVMAKPDVGLRATPTGLTSVTGADAASLNRICRKYGGTMRPLFGDTEERLLRERATFVAAADAPNLAVYYRVDAPANRLEAIAAELRRHPLVDAAYVKAPAQPMDFADDVEFAKVLREQPPPVTPDFTHRQGYLDAAPGGVDARHAWTRPGGRGADVRIISVESAWRFTHEALLGNQGGVVGGEPSARLRHRNHGTASLGIFGGDGSGIGVTGICPDATVSAVALSSIGSSRAIREAALRLRPGDIIVLELGRLGPVEHTPVEWWQDEFDAIRTAVLRGVIVVASAGNSGAHLDDPAFDTPMPGFPAFWANPLRRPARDSGSILVGAGAPPPGTHGRDHGPDRSRIETSNFGSMVDVQGWGREITTCGYGTLQGGNNEDRWYTDCFGGTSGAAAMVAGVLGCLQGFLRTFGAPLTPASARNLLTSLGSGQQSAPGRHESQRIGPRPNLRLLMFAATPKTGKDTKEKEVKDGKEKEVKDIKDKDGGKENKESFLELQSERLFGPPGPAGSLIGQRLAHLEHTVARLVHFIGPELRPDLAASALAYDEAPRPDLQALSTELRRQALAAKTAKDAKDLEKLADR